MTTPRIFMGMLSGSPVFRVSKPGKSIYSTDVRDFLLREDMELTRATIKGTIVVANNTTENVDISAYGFTKPPLVRAHAPGVAMFWGISAWVVAGWQTIRISNSSGQSRAISYYVFDTTTEAI